MDVWPFQGTTIWLKQFQLFSVLELKITISERGCVWYTMYHIPIHALDRVGQSTMYDSITKTATNGREAVQQKVSSTVFSNSSGILAVAASLPKF